MTVHTPQPCVGAVMSLTNNAGANVALLDNGAYPGNVPYENDTWTWTGTDWTQKGQAFDTTAPLPGRIDSAGSYDGNNFVLFGGRGASATDGTLDDTWSWSGTAWTKLAPATSPSGRYKHEMAYLSTGANPGSVMFGGRNNNDFLEETWVWTGTTWTQIALANGTSPAARVDHAMAASPTAVLLFGGSTTNQQLNDTWNFNGTVWAKLGPATSPSARSGHCMAYDSSNSIWVMFGGANEYNYLPETWIFTGTNWQLVSVPAGTGPSGRVGASMAFDIGSHKTIMFGGVTGTHNNSAVSHTWSFDGAALTWTLL